MKNLLQNVCGVLITSTTLYVATSGVLPLQRMMPQSAKGLMFGDVVVAQDGSALGRDVFKKASPSVVTIKTAGSYGSGFIVSSDGLIVSNAHVVESDADNITVVLDDGRKLAADLIGFDNEGRDLAALKIYGQKNLTAIPFGNLTLIGQGDPVFAIGAPQGLQKTITQGIFSRFDKKRGAVQTDVAISGGNSGGPLLNSKAEVVGVNTWGIFQDGIGRPTSGLNFAIPVDQVKTFVSAAQQGNVARESQRVGQGQPKSLSILLDGKEVTGEINKGSGTYGLEKFYNLYAFEGKVGQQITLEMSSTELYPYIVLLRPYTDQKGKTQYEEVAVTDDDGADDFKAKLVAVLPLNGVYLLMAATPTRRSGKYSLRSSVATQSAKTVQVSCGETNDPTSQQNVPTTLVWNPERRATIALIRWKSQYFEQKGITPKQRCVQTSAKLQKALEEGRTWLVVGEKDKQSVLCAVKSKDDSCGSDYLFALKPGTNAKVAVRQLVNLFQGASSAPISQSGGETISINLLEVLQKQKPAYSS